MKTKVKTGGTRPQVQGRLGPPGAGRGDEAPLLEPLEGVQSRRHLDFRFLASGTGRKEVVVSATQAVVLCYAGARELIQTREGKTERVPEGN